MTAPPSKQPRGWRRWLLIALGWFFILLGIAGLVLPVLQGILFIAIGMLLLASVSYRVRRWLVRLRRRYPEWGAHFDRARQRIRSVMKRRRRPRDR